MTRQRGFNAVVALLSCVISLLFGLADPAHSISAPLPPDSIYQLPVTLKDQDGKPRSMLSMRGQAQIITMIYTHCSYVCPMTIETLKAVDAQLAPDQKARLHRLLVSLDPKRDTVPVLKKMMNERQLDAKHWTLARPAPSDVRKLAAVLGIQYRQLANKEFNHSSALILLDAQGRVRARLIRLGQVDRDFVEAVKAVLGERPRP